LRPALAYFNEPYWLPDGRSLVVFGRDFKGRGGIYRIDARDGRETLITEVADINPVQVSPDGRKIYYKIGYDNPEHRPARIVERDLISGETRDVHRKGGSSEGSIELSPDGRSLATIVTDEAAKTSTVMLIPIDGGEPRDLLRVSLPDRLAPYGNMSWTPDSRAVIVVKTNGDRKQLWRVPTSGGGAQKLDIDMAGWAIADFAGIRLHPSGRQIAFFVGQDSREVWALENIVPGSSAR
jgi:TolB protein